MVKCSINSVKSKDLTYSTLDSPISMMVQYASELNLNVVSEQHDFDVIYKIKIKMIFKKLTYSTNIF
jgi:hypothetical protein